MNQVLVIIAIAALGMAVAAAYVIRTHRARRAAGFLAALETLCRYLDLSPGERVRWIEEWLAEKDRPGRERAAGLILLGCAWLDRGMPEQAARPFQMAYHAEPEFISALVLAFTCMKVNRHTSGLLLEKTIETWAEVRRPTLGRSHWERMLLDACRRSEDLPCGSALAGALWSLPSEALRRQIQDALTRRPAWANALCDETGCRPDGRSRPAGR